MIKSACERLARKEIRIRAQENRFPFGNILTVYTKRERDAMEKMTDSANRKHEGLQNREDW